MARGQNGGIRRFAWIPVFAAFGVFAPPAWAPAIPSFTYSPAQPLTGQTVTFTSTSTGAASIGWDFDEDGFCDDATGATATTSFPVAGTPTIMICAYDGIVPTPTTQTQIVTVRNRPPTAAFTVVPSNPMAGEGIVLSSTSFDPDGPIAAWAWDLDGDGAFDDRTGETALWVFSKAGRYPVALRVTDLNGAATLSRQTVVVSKKPPEEFRPPPFIRLISHPINGGGQIDLLTVKAPKGAKIGVRCRGRGCPWGRKRTTSKGKRVNLRKLRGAYRAGAVIEIRITKADTIGKYVRIRIRSERRPTRIDRCLNPGKPKKPIACETD